MNSTDFDFGSGHVVYWDLDDLVAEIPLGAQAERCLKEDLAQIRFGTRAIVDLGWYPSFDPDGSLVVLTVVDGNWEEPAVRVECKMIEELRVALATAVAVAQRIESLSYQ